MRILYSKNAIQMMMRISEKETAQFLQDVKNAVHEPPAIPVTALPGYSDHRKMFASGAYYGVFKKAVFKGIRVIYVMEILTEEDLSYYLQS